MCVRKVPEWIRGNYSACILSVTDQLSLYRVNNKLSSLSSFLIPGEIHSWPSMRGGHQLCVDPVQQILYLFGGWDGRQDLADLWAFDIQRKKWVCLCREASEEVYIYIYLQMRNLVLIQIHSPPLSLSPGWPLPQIMSQDVSGL